MHVLYTFTCSCSYSLQRPKPGISPSSNRSGLLWQLKICFILSDRANPGSYGKLSPITASPVSSVETAKSLQPFPNHTYPDKTISQIPVIKPFLYKVSHQNSFLKISPTFKLNSVSVLFHKQFRRNATHFYNSAHFLHSFAHPCQTQGFPSFCHKDTMKKKRGTP